MKNFLGTAALAATALLLTATTALAQAGLTAVPSPNVKQSDFNQLDGVAVAGASSAWAVGFARHAQPGCCAPFRALIEHWNATTWSVVPAASLPGGDATRLHAVTVISPANAWAVGEMTAPGGVSHSLIEHWDGTSWSVVPSPAAEQASATLAGISAASPADIWAVGTSGGSFGFQTLIEHWNGTRWSVVPGAPLLATGHNFLSGVAAISAGDAWAVGRMFRHPSPVIEHWNGTAWTQVTQPVGGYDSSLNSISAVSASDIWAVGEQNLNQTVTEHWDGASWTLVPSPSVTINNAQDTLSGVAALSPTDVWAAGSTLENFATRNTLALHWDGHAWQIVPSATSSGDFLNAVAGIAGQPLWAVGDRTDGHPVTATLIETTISAAVVRAGSAARAADPGGNGIVRAVAHIGPGGLGQAVCPGGDDVLGGGYVAADTDDGQLPVPVVMMPGDLGNHQGFFRVRLLERAGHGWTGGGSVVAVCLPLTKAWIGGLASRTVSFRAGIGRALCPGGDEATGGGFAVGLQSGSTAPPAPVSASTGTAEDGTSSYSVDLVTTAGVAFTGPATVTVRCLHAVSALGPVAIVNGSLNTSGQVAAVRCPTGEAALGGGYLSNYVAGQANRPLPLVNRPGTPQPAGYGVALASDQGSTFPPGGFLEARCLPA